jgi:hypothetical protein
MVDLKLCGYKLNNRDIPFEKASVVYMRGIKAIEVMNFKQKIELTTKDQVFKFFKRRTKHVDYYIGIKLLTDAYTSSLGLEEMKCSKLISFEPLFHVIAPKHKNKIPML